MTIVLKFDRNAVAAALSAMGYGNQPANVVGGERTASIVIGSGIGSHDLKSAAAKTARATVMHEAPQIAAAVARAEQNAKRAATHRRPAQKVSNGTAMVLAAGHGDKIKSH